MAPQHPSPHSTRSTSAASEQAKRSGAWLVGGMLLALLAVVIIIVGIVQAVQSTHKTATSGHQPAIVEQSNGHSATHLSDPALAAIVDAASLPAGGPYTERGTGEFVTDPLHVAPSMEASAAATPGQGAPNSVADAVAAATLGAVTIPYTIDIEGGINTSHIGGRDVFAWWVHSALGDPRGWVSGGRRSFHQFDTAGLAALQKEPTGVGAGLRKTALHFTLATPLTTRKLCGYSLPVETSCWSSQTRRVVINMARFVRGAATFPHDLAGYRYYVINHELGHGLGFGHEVCGAANGTAPVMMQQTLTLRNTIVAKLEPSLSRAPGFSASFTCQPNPWPNPENVVAATLPELPVSETP